MARFSSHTGPTVPSTIYTHAGLFTILLEELRVIFRLADLTYQGPLR